VAGSLPVSGLRARAEEYLAMRRTLGFKLTTFGSRLMSFVGFCEERGADRLTADLALEWALQTSRGSTDEVYQARRLDVVRIFARHLQALDPATEIPPDDVLSRRYRRIPPYLYSPEQITALMSAADSLAPAMRAATWRTLIGLLAVTGMRQGEACRLRRDHADLQSGTLVIADSKFGKSRQVFLHPTATAALHAYERARDQMFPEPKAATFLVNSRGSPLNEHNVQHTFATLIAAAGIQAPPGRRAPRLHDLRHTFTVATMLDWYRDGANAQARLPLLSTWLGHVDPKSTYWYLQATPELLALAAGRLEQAVP
jgi:integrase/recombinase XerD